MELSSLPWAPNHEITNVHTVYLLCHVAVHALCGAAARARAALSYPGQPTQATAPCACGSWRPSFFAAAGGEPHSAEACDRKLLDVRRGWVATARHLVDAVVMRAVFGAADELNELFVVCDHEQLEVGLLPPRCGVRDSWDANEERGGSCYSYEMHAAAGAVRTIGLRC